MDKSGNLDLGTSTAGKGVEIYAPPHTGTPTAFSIRADPSTLAIFP